MRKFQLTEKEVNYFKEILSAIKCREHQINMSCFNIKYYENKNNGLKFIMIPACNSCFVNGQNEGKINFQQVSEFIQVQNNFRQLFRQAICPADELKLQIIEYLKTKLVRIKKYISFYQALSCQNKQFFSQQSPIIRISRLISDEKLDKIQKQYLMEYKNWMKQPQKFETNLGIQMTKNNLDLILKLKYCLIVNLLAISQFFNHSGLICQYQMLMKLLVDGNMERLKCVIARMYQKCRNQSVQNKILVMKHIKSTVKMQTNVQSINQYLSEFIKLYYSYDNIVGGRQKFNVSQKVMKYFNFDISLTTVVLRNPNLNYETIYEQPSYHSEFMHVNDGQYTYNNQNRQNILCEQQLNPQRSPLNLIYSQFHQFHQKNQQQQQHQQQQNQGNLVQIKNFLKDNDKIYLRLRLNSQQMDKVTLKIMWSSTFQLFLQNKRDHFLEINLLVIPDDDNNQSSGSESKGKVNQNQNNSENLLKYHSISHYHEANLKNKFKTQLSHQILEKLQQEQVYPIMEDDIVSLSVNMKQNSLLCLNETRRSVIKSLKFKQQMILLKVCDQIQFRAPIYAAVVLYSTVSEIEIFDPKERK